MWAFVLRLRAYVLEGFCPRGFCPALEPTQSKKLLGFFKLLIFVRLSTYCMQ